MSDKPNTAERYARATRASNLMLRPQAGPVDMLIAAGLASMGAGPQRVALHLSRIRSGDFAQFEAVADVMADWLRKRARREGFRDGGRDCRNVVVRRTMFWWANPACPFCEGRGHPKIADTPMLDTSRVCGECNGTGVFPLERMVRSDYIDAAKVLSNEMDRVTAEVFHRMKKLSKNSLTL